MEENRTRMCFVSGTLRREDSRSLHRFVFSVPVGAKEITLRLSYHPRQEENAPLGAREFRERWDCEIARYRAKVGCAGDPALLAYYERLVDGAIARIQPIHNLLNLAVFDSTGAFRGRWDSLQHFARQVSIGEAEATRGFVPGALPPGQWTCVLECHAVVTDACSYELELQCALSQGSWYRGELHAHTNHSDGTLSPDALVDAAADAGLDFIAITDHNTVSGLHALQGAGADAGAGASAGVDPGAASARDGRPLVLPGIELTTFHGHAVAIGASAFIPWYDVCREQGLDCQTADIHRQGGIFSIAHPFSIGYPVCAGCEWEYDNTDPGTVDLVEVWSGPWTSHVMWNVLALRWWDRMLREGYRVTGVAARDVHKREDLFEKETADTYVWARSLSGPSIVEGLRAGRVVMSSGPTLDFSLGIGGRETLYLPGDRALARSGDEMEFVADLRQQGKAETGGLVVRIIRGSGDEGVRPVCATRADGDRVIAFKEVARSRAWYRCEVVGDAGHDLPGPHLQAMSNPIYVEVAPREDS